MSEEANVRPEEKKEEKKEEVKKEEPKKEISKKEEKKREVVQKPTNCMKCNKRLQRKTCYYRNEGYYCSKRCWELAEEAKANALKAEAAKKAVAAKK